MLQKKNVLKNKLNDFSRMKIYKNNNVQEIALKNILSKYKKKVKILHFFFKYCDLNV